MSNDIDVTSTEGEIVFNFDKWIIENDLADIKHIFVKHNMKTADKLSALSPTFKDFISDPALIINNALKISVAVSAMQKLTNLNLNKNPKQKDIDQYVVIAEEEDIVMDKLQENISKLGEFEQKIKDLNNKYPQSIKHIKDVKLKQIKQTKNKINKIFSDINNTLSIKQQILLKTVANIQINDDDNKEDDVISNSMKILNNLRKYLALKHKECKKMIDSTNNNNRKQRKKRKDDIIQIGKEANDEFNKILNELNKNCKIIQNMIDINNKSKINIDFKINDKIYKKFLNKVNKLGTIVNEQHDASGLAIVDGDEDEDDVIINKLKRNIRQQKVQIVLLQDKLEEVKNNNDKDQLVVSQSVINALSLSDDYRWYIESEQKQNCIQIGKINVKNDNNIDIVFIDGKTKENVSANTLSQQLNVSDIKNASGYIDVLKQCVLKVLDGKPFADDKWDISLVHSSFDVSDNVITRKSSSASVFTRAFLSRIVGDNGGKFRWKFKITNLGTGTCGHMQFVICTNDHAESYGLDKGFNVSQTVYGFFGCTGKINSGGGTSFGTSYGIKTKKDDIIEMIADFDSLTLSFIINGTNYGKSHDIKKGKYRAGATAYYPSSSIQFLDMVK